MGFPDSSAGEENRLQCGRPGFSPWVGKIPWKTERLPIPVFWSGEFHGLYSPWGCKELDMTEWLSLHFTHTHTRTHTHIYINRSLGRNSLSITLKILFIYLTVPCLSRGLWDLVPSPGIEPRPPALTGQSLSPQESPTFNLLWCYTVMGPYSSPWSPGEACQKTETWPQILSAALILILFLLKDSCILTLLYIKHPSCKVRLGSATTAAGYSLLGLQM